MNPSATASAQRGEGTGDKQGDEVPVALPRVSRGGDVPGWYRWLPPIGVIGALVLWQAVVVIADIRPIFLPSPIDTFRALWEYAASGLLAVDAKVSAQEFALGFALALVMGIVVGFAMGASRILSGLLQPIVNMFMAIPYIALFPVLIVWFGIGISSKVVIVVIAGIFPIIVNTAAGVQSVDRELVRMARGFRASRFRILLTISAPGSVPFMVSGVRLALARGLTAVVVGELLAAQAGLGYRIAQTGARFDTSAVFAGIIVISAVALALNAVISRVEKHFQRWRIDA